MRVLNLVVCLVLAGSATASVFAATRDDAPGDPSSGWEDLSADLERRVALEVEAARRAAEAEEHYRRGVQFLQRSRRSEALDQFRQAESVALDAGEEAYMASSLRIYLHEVRARIAGEDVPSDLVKPALGPSPEKQVDQAALLWLASAVRRPIPEEPALRDIFRRERVPEELIYVGLVESGYQRNAISSAGAVGPWQFIDETGRRYGLGQGKDGDDRRNLLKATRAAARYLRDLYDLLGDWTLAVAGYNAGEYRVLRAMQQANAKDFWAARPFLPKETAAYVPLVLAAISIAKKTRSEAPRPGHVSPDIPESHRSLGEAFTPARIE